MVKDFNSNSIKDQFKRHILVNTQRYHLAKPLYF